MSRTPYFFVDKLDLRTGQGVLMHPYVMENGKMEIADLFPYNGAHELFSILHNEGDFAELYGIHRGLPLNTAREIKDELAKWDDDTVQMSLKPDVYWITYADLYIYLLENPTFIEEDRVVPNPAKILMDRVNAFLDVVEPFNCGDDRSLIRIVYWIM